MKRKSFILVCLLANIFLVSAQSVFTKGDKVLNVGIGFGNTLYTGLGYSSTIPPLFASLDVCAKDNLFNEKSSLGVGGFVGYASSEYKQDLIDFRYKYSSFILGVRGSLNYQLAEKLDTYAGLALGYNIVSGSGSIDDMYGLYSAQTSGLTFGLYLGGRYYFTDKLAGVLELGYDIAVAKIGIAYKF
jgi:hypothetical protein